MATINNNFEEHYEFAKNATIKAINSGENVVLYGWGGNGKSFLIQDLNTIINDNHYQILPNPEHHYDDSYPNKILKQSKKTKWITSIKHIKPITSSLKHCTFVFVNMNHFVHPEYVKPCSGMHWIDDPDAIW